MISACRTTWVALVLTASLGVLGVACGEDTADPAGGTTASGADTPDAGTSDAVTSESEGTEEFCAAVEVMDQHDGTTEESVAVAAIAEARRTAPDEVRADVELALDTFTVNNYPGSADPSAVAASIEEAQGAGERLASFIDQHC